ncbi:PO24 protein, partial [Burhinus bistriatus]|nr:PO24 protein [Burhinus bistriatus]
RANVYPTREFLSRGRQDSQNKSCRHCTAESETLSHIIGYCPIKDWVVFQEPLLRDDQNDLYKPDLIFVKEEQALVVDVTVRFESKPTSLLDAAKEKVQKYRHLENQIRELTNATVIKFVGFPLGARGKWHQDNYELLKDLGLSCSRQEKKVARHLSRRALLSSVDIVHIFASQARSGLISG